MKQYYNVKLKLLKNITFKKKKVLVSPYIAEENNKQNIKNKLKRLVKKL